MDDTAAGVGPLEAQGQPPGSLGHELRNQIAAVQMALLVLQRGEESASPDRRKKACAIIERQIRLLARSVDRFLAASTT
jgi:hypothetical protein